MKKDNKNYNLVISIIVLVLVIAFSIYIFLYKKSVNNFKLLVLNIGLLLVISIINVANQLRKKEKKSEFSLVNSIIVVIFAVCTLFITKTPTTVSLPKNETIPNFVGENVSEAISWANKHNIELIQNYEYSDTYNEYIVFAQDILPETNLSNIKKLALTISSGFNYDKVVILPSYVGQDIEEFLTKSDELHLNNVKIKYELNDYTNKNIIINQSKNGEIRRNDEIVLEVSLGKKSELSEISMPSLIGKSLFEATLFLEQNGINYEIKYDFSDQDASIVIAQSEEAETIIKPFDSKVILTVSKGSKILVPDLTKMSTDEIIKWVTDNNLKINLTDAYDSKIEAGKVISANYKENDEISEGALIKVVTSKGALKMLSFNSLSEFRNWANNYNIKYDEEYEFSNTVAKGNIIKFSLSPNDLIDINVPIVVTISNGKSLTIPNYVGKTKTEIASSCKSIGLNCTFSYSSYSQTAKDVALSQNKKAGSNVISGTSLIIYLSKGKAETFTIEISESQLTIGDANATANTLKSYFAKKYPDVTFTFTFQKSNVYSRAGFIHENSPVNDGKKVTQGNTYKVIITQ